MMKKILLAIVLLLVVTAATYTIKNWTASFNSIADLRLFRDNNIPITGVVTTHGYTTFNDGGGNKFQYDSTDTTTADNGGSIIVDRLSRRWKQVDNYHFDVRQWGTVGDGLQTSAVSNRTCSQAALTFIGAKGGYAELIFPNTGAIYYVAVNSQGLSLAANSQQYTLRIDGYIKAADTNGVSGNFFLFGLGGYKNITITGRGTLDCNDLNITSGSPLYGKESGFRIDGFNNLVMEGITVTNASYALNASRGTNALVQGVTISDLGNNDPVWGKNADGVHFFNCSDVRIIGNNIETTDDCIAITQAYTSTTNSGFVIMGNTLRPYGGNISNPPEAIRVGIESSLSPGTEGEINDIIIDGNTIDCHASGIGITLGGNTVLSPNSRYHHRVKISNNIIRGAAGFEPISIGPNAGSDITTSGTYASIQAVNCVDITLENNILTDQRNHGVFVRNCGLFKMTGGSISNVVANTDGTTSGTSAITFDLSVSDIDTVELGGGLVIDGTIATGIGMITSSTYALGNFICDGVIIHNHNTGAVSGSATLAGIHVLDTTTAQISNTTITDGFSDGILIEGVVGSSYFIKNCKLRNNNTTTGLSTVYHMRLGTISASTAIAGKYYITGCDFETFNSAMALFQNCEYFSLLNNNFISPDTSGTPSGNGVTINYGTGVSVDTCTFLSKGNTFNIVQSSSLPAIAVRVTNTSGHIVTYRWLNNSQLSPSGITFVDTAANTVGGANKVNITSVGNVGSGTDDLMTRTLQPGLLLAIGDCAFVNCGGTFAANTNAKQLSLIFGGTTLFDSTSLIFNGVSWSIQAWVYRTSATTQRVKLIAMVGGAVLFPNPIVYTTAAETMSGNITIKCQGAGTADNDIVQTTEDVTIIPNSPL